MGCGGGGESERESESERGLFVCMCVCHLGSGYLIAQKAQWLVRACMCVHVCMCVCMHLSSGDLVMQQAQLITIDKHNYLRVPFD